MENFLDYIEACFQLTPSDEQKLVREMYQDFNKQTYNRQKLIIRIHYACLSPSTGIVYLPPLMTSVTGKKNTKTSSTIIFLFIFRNKINIILLRPAMLNSNGTLLTLSWSSGGINKDLGDAESTLAGFDRKTFTKI